jgi:hypothetical protein
MFTLPPEYTAGGAVQIRLASGMLTTVADTTATILAAAYKSNRDTTITGTNLVTTSAATTNSLTFSDKTFTLSGGSLTPGDVLDIRVAIATNDAATVTTTLKGAITAQQALLTIRG